MHIASDRVYRFDVGPEAFWSAVSETGHYRQWWPWLRRFEAGSVSEGQKWDCVVQPPFPYRLSFTVDLLAVTEAKRVEARIGGDIEGDAQLEIEHLDSGCQVRLQSRLAPANGLLKAVARLAEPVARLGHDWVLDTGARQFRARALNHR